MTSCVFPQVWSFFGASLAAIDLDNDQEDELIIGAPYYTETGRFDQGAVYIYRRSADTGVSFSLSNLTLRKIAI